MGASSGPFTGKVISDRTDPVIDSAQVIQFVPKTDLLVQLRERFNNRHRGESVGAEPAHLTFGAVMVPGG